MAAKTVDRALKGEAIMITRRGQPAVESKPVQPAPRPITDADIEWLRRRRALLPRLKTDSATLIRQMRDEECSTGG